MLSIAPSASSCSPFNQHLSNNLAEIDLSPEIRREIDAQRIKLAAIEVPAEVDVATKATIEGFIDESFIAGFRLVMWIASGLAIASAAIAWFIIRDKP